MSAQLESLIVDLQVNSAALKTGLDKANARLMGFAKKADKAGKLVAAALAFEVGKQASVALASFVRSGADAADKMGDLAQAVGVPVDALSRLDYAASFSGISTETLGTNLSKLSKQMAEAASGAKKPSALFAALGVSVSDATGELRGSDAVLTDVAEAFSKMEDGAAKTALAQEIFGKSGAGMVVMLNEGRDGLQRFAEESDRFGTTITERGAASAALFNDTLDRFGKISKGVAIRLAEELTPNLAALGEELLGSEASGDLLRGTVTVLAGAIRALVTAGVIVGAVFKHVGVTIAGASSALLFAAQGDFAKAKASMMALGETVVDNVQSTVDRIGAIWTKNDSVERALESQKKKVRKSSSEMFRMVQAAASASSKVAAPALPAWRRNQDAISYPLSARDAGTGSRISRVGAAAGAGPLAMIEAQDRLANAAANAGRALQNEFVPRLGKVGELIDAAQGELANKVSDVVQSVGGGASVGGVIGAVVGVIASLLSESSGFVGLVDMVGQVVGVMADALNPIVEPITLLIAGLLPLAPALVKFVGLVDPIGALLKVVVDTLVPLFAVVGAALSGLAPMMKMLTGLLLVGLVPILGQLVLVMPMLFEGFKLLGIGALSVARWAARWWNSVTAALAAAFSSIADFKIGEWKPFEGLNSFASGLTDVHISISDLDASIAELNDLTIESALAAAAAAVAKDDETKSSKKATEAFLNAPAGYKTALARFNAIAPSGGSAASSPGPALPVFGKPVALPTQEIIVTVKIDGPEIFEVVDAHAKKQGMRKKGSRFASP